VRLFLLVRHGQSLFNVDKVVNGDPTLDRGLSEQGIEEAERLAGQIAALPLDLGDVRIGELEGRTLDDYRKAPAHSNRRERFPGGESLDEAALRYAGAFERLLARHEPVTLVVCHEIPVRYLVNAAAGSEELNGPLTYVANATPYLFDEPTLRRGAERMRELAG
jgi:broad specificity phosphatase PhoE